ncbi:fibronectin type III domain-containing protein [Candidatus Sumerlaeota bacterium]|nr:fibronectin type III domain-containing protein [Candidatus Sumerlaeota bacterium]
MALLDGAAIFRGIEIAGSEAVALVDLSTETLSDGEAELLTREITERSALLDSDITALRILVRPPGASAAVPIEQVIARQEVVTPEPDMTLFGEPAPPAVRSAARNAVSPNSQPQGGLSGRVVYFSGGHGWTWSTVGEWYTQRPLLYDMVEDYGNLDQINVFARYCFNAGATVVPMRPIGYQPNEVIVDNDDPGFSTTPGAWNTSTGSPYYGDASDSVHYRWTETSATETTVARYTPTIPEEGFYPVYTWVLDSSNRTDQLYRIVHSGGACEVRVDHRNVGRGWVYLGEYHFLAGTSGHVEISNQSAVGGNVIADAIRFGNGIGDINRGGGVSGYQRGEEASRYWVQSGIGQGGSSSVYDGSSSDSSDNVGTPPRMAANMNRNTDFYGQVYLGFHSNASSGAARGCVALITTSGSPTHQAEYAKLIADNLDAVCNAADSNWEHPWVDRSSATYTSAYGEISSGNINDEMTATIIEVAFHDNALDADLMRDPNVRDAMARGCYQGIVRYFNTFDATEPPPLVFLPSPPRNVRAINTAPGEVTISWLAPLSGVANGGPATGHRVWQSPNGLGFAPVATTSATSFTVSDLPLGETFYFRVAATNAGGESMPSEVVGVGTSPTGHANVLVVNGFDRFDRTLDPQDYAATNIGGTSGGGGFLDRIRPREMNSFDYVAQHGEAIAAAGRAFDSCANEAVTAGQVNLTDYRTVVWICGEESTDDETFSATEQSLVSAVLGAGGNLFVSGSEIAWDLDRDSGPSTADRAFINSQLHTDLNGNANNDAGTYSAAPSPSGIFIGNPFLTFDDGTHGGYDVDSPDELTAVGGGATVAMGYVGGGAGGAAIVHDGSGGGGKVVFLGFPFEMILGEPARAEIMADAMAFFSGGIVGDEDILGVLLGLAPPSDSADANDDDVTDVADLLTVIE